jgi:hypothetical protein
MSDLAYFEYTTVIPPEGSQGEGTPAHYLVEVLISDPVTHEERGPAELKRIANDFLALVLNRGVNPNTRTKRDQRIRGAKTKEDRFSRNTL